MKMSLEILLAIAAIALGGILKGATGAGAPIVAVPILAMLYDVPMAVTVFVVPNLLSNVWQGWHYRAHRLPWRFAWVFAGGGAAGSVVGTWMLARLPSPALLLLTAAAVFIYIAFRLMRPDWRLGYGLAQKLALPVGAVAGVLQGAAGVSAPISLTFLNAMKLDRAAFIATVSLFFAGMSCVQIPMLAGYGFLTPLRLVYGFGALAVIMAFMPLGAALARRVSRQAFDRLILCLLALVAIRLAWSAL
jgi:uncharacterized membrane protein YfcA